VSDRIDKTLQKYVRKERNNLISSRASLLSRNGLQQSQSQGVNSIHQMQRIYNTAAFKTAAQSSTNKQAVQQLVSFQSPYLNSENITGNTLYNVRHGGKLQVKSSGNNSNMHTPLGSSNPAAPDQFSQFRQANSYSVDRISRFQNVYSSATNSAIKQFQMSDSREKTDLSFESSKAAVNSNNNKNNNSFTLGVKMDDFTSALGLGTTPGDASELKQQLALHS